MKRRTFLTQLGYGVPATLAFPAFLSSCKKNNGDADGIPADNRFKDYKVVVIGAGAAGLYTGWYLKERGFEVTILEATNRIGGRIKPLKGFADYDIELGAERIYGSNTQWYNMVNETGFAFNDAQPEDYYFFRQNGNDLTEPPLKNRAVANQYSDFNAAMDFIQTAPSYTGADISVGAAFATGGHWSVAGVLNGLVGNRQGTNNDRLGMKGYAQERAAQTANEQAFTLKNATLLSVLEKKFASVIPQVQLNSPVEKIDYQGDMIHITKNNGQTIVADRVVITVPLTVLKKGAILFNPGLPSTKLDALDKLGMMAGMKVHLQFSIPFWNDITTPNQGSIFGHHFLPEIYISNLGRSDTPIITAYIMGERAEQFSSMGNTAVSVMLGYLEEIYSSQVPIQSFVQGGSHVADWSKEPYIEGAYSYPLVGGGIVFRKELAEPIDNKIFFAGEATNFNGHSGTVHGAIETGLRTVQQLEESIA